MEAEGYYAATADRIAIAVQRGGAGTLPGLAGSAEDEGRRMDIENIEEEDVIEFLLAEMRGALGQDRSPAFEETARRGREGVRSEVQRGQRRPCACSQPMLTRATTTRRKAIAC